MNTDRTGEEGASQALKLLIVSHCAEMIGHCNEIKVIFADPGRNVPLEPSEPSHLGLGRLAASVYVGAPT